MIAELTENDLKIGKYECRNAAITKNKDGAYSAVLFHVTGWTEYRTIKDKWGDPIKRTYKLRKLMRFKEFEYKGIELEKQSFSFYDKYKLYLFAKNKKDNYINYYEED